MKKEKYIRINAMRTIVIRLVAQDDVEPEDTVLFFICFTLIICYLFTLFQGNGNQENDKVVYKS